MDFIARGALALALSIVPIGVFAGTNIWTSVGPEGGNITRVVIDRAHPDTVFALVPSGVFRSTDDGATWTLIKGDFVQTALDLAIDPSSSSRVYAAGFGENKLLASSDGGATFAPLASYPDNAGGTNQGITQVEFDSAGAVIYVSAGPRVFRSTDHGASWVERAQVGPPGTIFLLDALVVDPADSSTLYAVARHPDGTQDLYTSTNGGGAWQPLEQPTTHYIFQLAATYDPAVGASSRRLWSARETNLFVSTDQGHHFSAGGFNAHSLFVSVDPAHIDTVYTGSGDGKAFRSIDAGLHWSDISGSGTGTLRVSQLNGIFPHPTRPLELFVGGTGDIARTTNGGTSWAPRHSGLVASQVPALAANSAGDRIYLSTGSSGLQFLAGGSDTVAEVNNDALRLTAPFPLLSMVSALHAQEGAPGAGAVFAAIDAVITRSLDDGNTWAPMHFPQVGANTIVSITSSPLASSVLFAGTSTKASAASGGGAFRSTDGGDHWTPVNAGLPSDVVFSRVVSAPSDPALVYSAPYLANSVGQAPTMLGVYRWNDGATRWDAANTGFTSTGVSDLQVDPTNAQIVYATTGAGLLKSTNGGGAWTLFPWDATVNAGGGSLIRVAINPANPQIIYVTSVSRVARSVTGGDSWEMLPVSPSSAPWYPTAAIADPLAPATLVVGTTAAGVQRLTVAPDLAAEVISGPPSLSAHGDALNYEFAARDIGPYHGTDVVLTLQWPAGATSVTLEPGNLCASAGGSSVVCPIGLLRAGFTSSVKLHATPAAIGPFQVTASLQGAEPDPAIANNSVTSATTVAELSDVTVQSSGTANARVGDPVSYTIAVSNSGPNTATAAQLVSQVAAGLGSVTFSTTRGACTLVSAVLTCNLGDLAKSESATVSITSMASAVGTQSSTTTVSSGSTEVTASDNTALSRTEVAAAPPPPPPPPTSGGGTTNDSGGGGGSLSLLSLLFLAMVAIRRAVAKQHSEDA